jgi:hypothetical protein
MAFHLHQPEGGGKQNDGNENGGAGVDIDGRHALICIERAIYDKIQLQRIATGSNTVLMED